MSERLRAMSTSDLKRQLVADLLEVAEWFGDAEHGEPLTSSTVPTCDASDWAGYVDPVTLERSFRLSERSYVALCAALDVVDELDARDPDGS